MPQWVDEKGNVVSSPDGGEVVTPAAATVDDKLEQENGGSFLEDVGQFASLAANSATMGIAPALVGLVDSEAKNKMLGYLEKGRENLGGWGTVAEIGGALAMPIPGMGAVGALGRGATIAAKAARAGKVLGKGAALGAVSSGLSYAGSATNESMNVKDAADAMLAGAGIGAVGGVAADKLGGLLASRAKGARFSAGGGQRGDIKKLASSGPGATPKAIQIKADKVAQSAEKHGWIGKFGATAEDSAEAAASTYGKTVNKMEKIIQQHGTAAIPAGQVVADLEQQLISGLARSKGGNAQMSKANKEAVKTIIENVKDSLGYQPPQVTKIVGPNGQPVIKPESWNVPSLTVADVQNLKGNIRDMVWGPLGTSVPANNVARQAQAKAAMFLSDLENGLISAVNPKAAKEFAALKELSHHAKLWENMGRGAHVGQQGLVELATGKGFRSIPDTAVVHMLLSPIRSATGGVVGGPITSQAVASRLMGSDRNANNMIALKNMLARVRAGQGQGIGEKALQLGLKRGKPTLMLGQATGVGSATGY